MVPAVSEIVNVQALIPTIRPVEEVGQAYRPRVRGGVIVFVGNARDGFTVWPWFLKGPKVFVEPPKSILDGIVQVTKSCVAGNQKPPPNSGFDFRQGHFELVISGHRHGFVKIDA